MKLYDYGRAPNPRRVRIFLAEKGLEIPKTAIDIATRRDLHYTTRFIGAGGQLLDVQHGASPRYRVTGHEGYVRARIDDSDGLSAWTQPRFL